MQDDTDTKYYKHYDPYKSNDPFYSQSIISEQVTTHELHQGCTGFQKICPFCTFITMVKKVFKIFNKKLCAFGHIHNFVIAPQMQSKLILREKVCLW